MLKQTNGSPWRTVSLGRANVKAFILTIQQIRRLYHHTLHLNKSAEYVPYQEVENKQLLYDMMTDSSDLLDQFRRYSSSLVTSIVYG
jgi:hypothetical protein